MTRSRPLAADLADLARQAREQLGRTRDSRWPGLAAPAVPAAAAPVPAVPPKTPSRPAAPPRQARSTASRPPAAAAAPAPRLTTPPSTTGPWNSLEEIAAAATVCTKCPLHRSRKQAVPGEGDPHARLMFVGEAPGADEDEQGRPFVGRAGQLLDKMIGATGLARGDVFIANVIKCRPPGNRDPEPREVAACLPYLHAQIALIQPEVICSLGKHAAHALLDSKEPISRLRGRSFEYRGVPLLPTFHPSYLLRSPGEKMTAWKDLQRVMKRLGLPAPAQNPDPDVWGRQ